MDAFDDFRADVAFGDGDVVLALKVEPELWGVAEIAGQAQRRIGGDGTPCIENAGDASRRYAQVEGET